MSEDPVSERPFLTAEWRHLLMVNFAVDPDLLSPHVPTGTMLDRHDGSAYLSLVAFRFFDTRVMGLRIPHHHDFDEINLRFYVRRETEGEVRRAVVFLREIVPRRAIAFLARALYNEPYIALPMRHRVSGDPPSVEYAWRLAGTWETLGAEGHGPGSTPPPDSHEAFITEHYWGYTRQRDGGTLEYRVAHPPWKVWPASLTSVPHLEPTYGPSLARAMTRPVSALIAEGSSVTVFRAVRLETAA